MRPGEKPAPKRWLLVARRILAVSGVIYAVEAELICEY
jgi:hypothetical protein